jgi:arylsulfatase A-like enzyme
LRRSDPIGGAWERRRELFRRIVRLAALGLGLAGAVSCRRGEVFFRAPVVVISIDTLRADHLPAYGYSRVSTPALEELQSDSILFENAYSHVPLTLPSHVTLLTGLLPPQNGVRDNTGYALGRDRLTLPACLGRSGYATGAAARADD